MIIVLIILALFLISLVFTIIMFILYGFDNEIATIASTPVIFGVVAISASIPCMIQHAKWEIQRQVTSYEVKIDDFKDRENTINLYLDGKISFEVTTDATTYHVVVDQPIEIMDTINQYNTDVKKLKQDIYNQKIKASNPWINWYVCPAYKQIEGYNAEATSYRDVLGDTLRTFEITHK